MTNTNENTNANGGTVAHPENNGWWLLALRGFAAVVFGVLAFLWPGITLLTLVYLFSAYALVNGVLAFMAAARAPQDYPRGGLVFEGILSIAAGVVAFLMPGITALALLVVIAAWAIIGGIVEIVAAVRLRRLIPNEWMLVLAGIASIVFGILMLIWPGAGALAIVWWIGALAIVTGGFIIALAFRLRTWTAIPSRVKGA
jgi:uncharacterized membrane protein HdeD (DUF308 family)